ncbi:MAG TPA: methyltransferase domain-containing protein [Burkholderiaceae bacterium]|jgi:tRNA G46 methylase TrmB
MQGNSAPVTSSQVQAHEGLHALVERHAAHAYRKPVAPYNRSAFESSIARWRACGSAPLILDAGCGVGLSTLHLAAQFPDHFVIGVDQSADRIARNTHWDGVRPDNFLWVRADLVDYWRLMQQAGIRPVRHYVLYPNPWPKIGQVQRRWHGHPVFPTVVALGGHFECRSNWDIYIDECSSALIQLSGRSVQSGRYVTDLPITPFESKYLESGHALWRCTATLET